MGRIFQSLGWTLLAGGVLLGLLILAVGNPSAVSLASHAWWTFVFRWLHVMSAILWVGLLWYFNFVQTPSLPKIPEEQRPAISKFIAPAALFWFRWAALATVILGLGLASMNHYILPALLLQAPFTPIGTGMWLGLVMAFNVWFLIWPLQKKALGLVPAEISEKVRATRFAMLVSRFNTMLSIPMIYCMVAQQHGGL